MYKCIDECHFIERCRSKWIITRYKQRSFVVASFFASTYTCTFYRPCHAFFGFNGLSMIQSSPLLKESSKLRFRFCLTQFRDNMFVKSEPYSAAQNYANYAYAYCTCVFCVNAYVHTRTYARICLFVIHSHNFLCMKHC